MNALARAALFVCCLATATSLVHGTASADHVCWVKNARTGELACAVHTPGQEPEPDPQRRDRPGGGEGLTINCTYTPGPDYTADFGAADVGNFRVTNGVVEMAWVEICGTRHRWYWQPINGTPEAPGAPIVTPQDLVPGAFDSVERQLPTPVPVIAPADRDPDGYVYVQNRAFFWVAQAPGQWAPVTATASVPGLSVTVTAEPVQLEVDPGDGGERVVCPGAPPALALNARPSGFDGCAYTYRDSSAMAPNGETYPVTVTIVWHATWQASNGASGDLGRLSTTSTTRDLPVAEIQAVVTQG